jgi:hypothetical protein
MITTSEKYKEVLKYPLRPRSHIKVTFNNSNNDFEGSSYRADAINGVSMPNKMRGFYFHNETCYAFLSKDFMRTDGSQIVLPTDSSKRYDAFHKPLLQTLNKLYCQPISNQKDIRST